MSCVDWVVGVLVRICVWSYIHGVSSKMSVSVVPVVWGVSFKIGVSFKLIVSFKLNVSFKLSVSMFECECCVYVSCRVCMLWPSMRGGVVVGAQGDGGWVRSIPDIGGVRWSRDDF